MISRVLVANRGEIACRIIRACKALGLSSIAIYSDADAGALHCRMADHAYHVGGPRPADSYLNISRIIDLCIDSGADAVHPGYGFLAENADFARQVTQAGIKWIGPDPDTLEQMGDKGRAREIASSFGVPVLPASDRLSPGRPDQWLEAADQIGYPLLIKATEGGGGIGMCRVDSSGLLKEAVVSTQGLALKSFACGDVYLERYVPKARHIEVQVFGYGDGHAVHMYERECSVQRRYQKIIEESPAPNLPQEVLDSMTADAVRLVSGMAYCGAGTVEFIVDMKRQEYYFLEMNTRIQVEHPVTEMTTGIDLVGMQIQLAAGQARRYRQEEIKRSGSAIECRIYAENPTKKFFPSPGLIELMKAPEESDCVRVESGFETGDTVSHYYDPMLAKLIVSGTDRETVIANMQQALLEFKVDGLKTNIPFLQSILSHHDFQHGMTYTDFIGNKMDELLQAIQQD